MRSAPLSCGVCFQAFVYVNIHVCLYLKPLYLAQNSETVKQCTSVLLVYLMPFNVVDQQNRIFHASGLVFSITKAVSFPLSPEVPNRDGVLSRLEQQQYCLSWRKEHLKLIVTRKKPMVCL